MTSGVKQLVDLSLTKPVRLAADASAAAPATLKQEVLRLKGAAVADKVPVLCALCARSLRDLRTIVFCSHKRHAHWLKILMGIAGLPAASELHGDMTQAARLQALEAFRKGKSYYLLATDVAARGLDILGVQAVVNYDCPRSLATYLHRVGRTARAGAHGLAISLVADADRGLIKMVMKHVRKQMGRREMPKHVVQSWRSKVEAVASQVDDILKEEKEEKALRMAEMEAAKANNILEHEAEIYSRPKKEWFQSEKQRRASSKAAAEQEVQMEDKQTDKSILKKGSGYKKGATCSAKAATSHVTDTKHIMGSVKAAKSAARQFRDAGSRPKEAAKAALTATGAAKREKQKKRKQPSSNSRDDNPASLKKRTHVYAGGGQSAKVKAPRTGLSKMQKARVLRGGKGKGQFKSKQKFKRK